MTPKVFQVHTPCKHDKMTFSQVFGTGPLGHCQHFFLLSGGYHDQDLGPEHSTNLHMYVQYVYHSIAMDHFSQSTLNCASVPLFAITVVFLLFNTVDTNSELELSKLNVLSCQRSINIIQRA